MHAGFVRAERYVFVGRLRQTTQRSSGRPSSPPPCTSTQDDQVPRGPRIVALFGSGCKQVRRIRSRVPVAIRWMVTSEGIVAE